MKKYPKGVSVSIGDSPKVVIVAPIQDETLDGVEHCHACTLNSIKTSKAFDLCQNCDCEINHYHWEEV